MNGNSNADNTERLNGLVHEQQEQEQTEPQQQQQQQQVQGMVNNVNDYDDGDHDNQDDDYYLWLLLQYGVLRIPLPPDFDCAYWADTLSQVTPMIVAGEGDGNYAFYRNILEEPDFPLDQLLDYFAPTLQTYFGVSTMADTEVDNVDENSMPNPSLSSSSNNNNSNNNTATKASSLSLNDVIRLDDAFCVHYNMTQDDTSGAKHTDPSDITINMCLYTSPDMQGSQVQFYGTESLFQHNVVPHPATTNSTSTANRSRGQPFQKEDEHDETNHNHNHSTAVGHPTTFYVRQKQGYATLHWGHHPHETKPLLAGARTNVILTYCFRDASKSQAANRSCYFPS
ncbi:hypothetical protein ACA910_012068 [Epithemia clementina (nom. ined.)]